MLTERDVRVLQLLKGVDSVMGGSVRSWVCECNDLKCRRTVALSESDYRRLSATGNVVHGDHLDERSGALSVGAVHFSIGEGHSVSLVPRSLRGVGVRAW